MLSYIYIRTCLWVLIGFFSLAGSVPWVDPSREILDELNDAEIYKAVVSSMNEWQKRQNLKKINGRIKREDSVACYPELGCFEASGPFGYLDMLPDKPEEINTKFLLYPARHSRRRRASPPAEVPFSGLKEAFVWAKEGFNNSLPTKVLIHGFGSDCSHIWIYEMRSALMAVEEVNVICVDWENGAILPNYVKAAANTRLVGKQLAMLLKGLVDINGLSLRDTHLVGFSLGAHVAGFAGAELGNLSRITGLDPAGPLFESQDPRARLDQSDAAFVDVIHSNGENLILGGLGSYQPMGHVDFYPNGGRMQKGCSNLFVGAVSDIIWSSAIEGRSLCNHRRAYKFFTDSVSPRCHFPAFPCETYEDFLAGKCFPCSDERSCGNMGYYADRSKGRGQLFLITRDEEPFCAHQYHVKIETSPTETPIVSYGKIQVTLVGDADLNETFMMTRKEDEEMKLGDSISRILVPHPILSEPTRIQVLYTAYSGWLSSGLTQWKMDKITLSDSFGKVSSVCEKNLILESGVPITLPLYPGECNIPEDPEEEEEGTIDRNDSNKTAQYLLNAPPKTHTNYTPTTVIKVGPEKDYKKDYKNSLSFTDAIEFLNLPWRNDKENSIDSDTESSRAFNTRLVKATSENKHKADKNGLIREIVEPILKPHSSKNARSHNPDKDKPEITEPILGPTTAKNFRGPKAEIPGRNDFLSKITNANKELTYNFYDSHDGEKDEWAAAASTSKEKSDTKYKRQDDSTVITSFVKPKDDNPLEVIVTTVQFLPQRLARMFEQAEKYTRETILPLVSTYTPKFISDIFVPKEKPKYVPLSYQETSSSVSPKASERRSLDVSQKCSNCSSKPKRKRNRSSTTFRTVTFKEEDQNRISSTPYSHIQKIARRGSKIKFIFPENQKNESENSDAVQETNVETPEKSRKARDDGSSKRGFSYVAPKPEDHSSSNSKTPKPIYIDLPVFEVDERYPKYIPLTVNSRDKHR